MDSCLPSSTLILIWRSEASRAEVCVFTSIPGNILFRWSARHFWKHWSDGSRNADKVRAGGGCGLKSNVPMGLWRVLHRLHCFSKITGSWEAPGGRPEPSRLTQAMSHRSDAATSLVPPAPEYLAEFWHIKGISEYFQFQSVI